MFRPNLAGQEVVLDALAPPDLIFVLQIDRALRNHVAGLLVHLQALRGQYHPFVPNDEIVGDNRDARLVVVLNFARLQGFDFNALLFRFLRCQQAKARGHQQKQDINRARHFHLVDTAKQNRKGLLIYLI